MFHHVFAFLGEYYQASILAPLASNFRFGVHMFFVLSAFLLFRQMSLRKTDPLETFKSFYIRRFFRTYPLWVFVCFFYYFNGGSLDNLFDNLTFLFGFKEFRQIPQAWSLFVEEIFYLLFPLIALFVTTLKRSLLLVGLTLVISYALNSHSFQGGYLINNYYISFWPFLFFKYFALGICSFFISDYLKNDNVKWVYLADFWILLTLTTAATNYFSEFSEVLLFGMMVCLLVPGSALNRLCSRRWITFIGSICYSIYLTHMFIIRKIFSLAFERDEFLPTLFLSKSPILFFGVATLILVVCILIAVITFVTIEFPMVLLGRFLIKKYRVQNKSLPKSSLTENCVNKVGF